MGISSGRCPHASRRVRREADSLVLTLAALAWLAFSPTVALPAAYVVSQGHPQASDENPGTEEKPLKTISGSLSRLQAGDTVWVRKGIYREQVVLCAEPWRVKQWSFPPVRSGKSFAQMISFFAAPGEEVVIKGSDVVKDWKPYRDKIWVRENWDANSQQVFVDGDNLQQIGGQMVKGLREPDRWRGRVGNGLADMKQGSFYCDLGEKRLYVWLKDGGDPNRHEIEATVRPFLWYISGRDYIRVAGFILRQCNTSAVVNWPGMSVSGNFNIIENVTVEWSDFGGIGVSGTNHTIVNSKFNYNGNNGIGAGGWGHRFINCETSYNNHRNWSASWHAGGVKIIPEAHDLVLSGHTAVYNYKSPGIWFDGMNSNVTIQDCVCHHNGLGIMYEISERATIKNNICYENEGRGIYISNSSYCAILHNLCYRNGMSGIAVVGVDRSADASGYGRGEKDCWPGGHNVVWGNILMDNCHPDLCPKGWSGRPELILPDDSDYNVGNVSDYNLFYRSDGRPIPFWKNWGGVVAKDLPEWQQKYGYDRHSRVAQPLFMDLAKRDFRPAEGSPALWMVKPCQSMRLDFAGAERPRKRTFLTAGPYEGNPKLLEAVLAGKTPTVVGRYHLVLLPDSLFESASLSDGSLSALAHATGAIKRELVAGGVLGFEMGGIPFAQKPALHAVRLSKDRATAILPVGKSVKTMHLLLAAVNPGSGPLATCVIRREDGVHVPLAWEGGKNMGPSIGPWEGKIEDLPGRPGKTQVVWRGISEKTPVRLFHTAWRNENEWYPIKQLEWRLDNPAATFLILAVTVE